MFDFIFDHIWGWIGLAGIIVIACMAVGYFFPPFRAIALAVAGVAISAAGIYTKGQRDRAVLEKQRKDKAVKKVNAEYAEIDKRPESVESLKTKLKRGEF